MGAGEVRTAEQHEQIRLWLQAELSQGRELNRRINRQSRQLAAATHGLAKFTVRMALVELTGSAAKWARRVHEGLLRCGERDGAELFAATPPFAATDPAPEDCERLSDWTEERLTVLAELLARQPY